MREKPTREEMLSHYIHFVLDLDLNINTDEKVVSREREHQTKALLSKLTAVNTRLRRVLFAIGAMEHPAASECSR